MLALWAGGASDGALPLGRVQYGFIGTTGFSDFQKRALVAFS